MLARIFWVAVAAALVTSPAPAVAAGGPPEEEELESAVSSPPMEMDDPGTPGPRGLEVNLVGSVVRAGVGRGTESLFDANYGIGERIQLKYERPYLKEGEVGGPYQHGLGATELGVKWRFADHGGFEAAVYPQYEFDDGFVLKDAEGNPEETPGRSVNLPLLISERVGRLYTLAANGGYRRNLDGRGDDINLALGAGRSVGRDGRLLGEVFSERDEDFHNRQTDVRLGYAFTLFARSQFEFPAFASIGHSLGRTEDGELTTSFTFGMSLIKKPRGEG